MKELTVKATIVNAINTLSLFCGRRDVEELTQNELQKRFGIRQADVMVLFGGSIICGGDELAKAMLANVAKTYLIVGGEGHTTSTLRNKIQQLLPT
ncbi:MAG: YdcF family protein, partial [Lachnospiraceae bacterium]|nr:YdcF family protein [Lachnospiraceae bacterium]